MPRESFTPSGIIRDLPATEIDDNIYTGGDNVVFREGLADTADKGVNVFQGTVANPGNPALGPPMNLINSTTFDGNYWLYPHDDNITQGWAVTDGSLHKDITPPVGFLGWVDVTKNPFTEGNISGFPYLNWGRQMGVWQRDFATPGPIDILRGLDDTSPTPVPSEAWVPTCTAMRTHQNRIMCLNTRDDSGLNGWPASEEAVVWSSLPDTPFVADVWDFFPRVTNSAGFAELSGGGPVLDGASLRSSFVVYLSNRIYIMDEVGGSFVFNIRKLSTSTGVLSRNCIAQAPGAHYVLSADDFYRNDGQSIESVIDNKNKKSLFLSMGDNFESAQCTYNAARNEVWILTPEGGDTYPTHAWVYDLGTGKFGEISFLKNDDVTPRQIPGLGIGPVPFPSNSNSTWGDETDVIPGTNPGQDPLIWGAEGVPGPNDIGRIWNQATEQSALPALVLADPDFPAFTSPQFISTLPVVAGDVAKLYRIPFVQRVDLTLGDDSRYKTVSRIWPRFTGGNFLTVFVRVGVRNAPATEAVQWTSKLPFKIVVDEWVDVPFISGKYVAVEISGPGSNGNVRFRVDGFDIEYQFQGAF